MQCGLDSGPGVTDGCWWVVRVVVEVFDELSGVVSRSPCGLEDEWDQIDAGVSVEFSPLFAFGHVAWEAVASGKEASVGGKGSNIEKEEKQKDKKKGKL